MRKRRVGVVSYVCLVLTLGLVLSGTPVAAAAPQQGDQQVYVVQAGDTLLAIAARFGVTVEAILAANGLDDANYIVVGQELVIPAPVEENAAPPAATARPDAQVYVVQAGDTLGQIATHFGVTVEELMQINGLTNPDYLAVGQELLIPTESLPETFPTPFEAISVTPLPVAQGQTLVIRVKLNQPATLSGEFDGRAVPFVSEQNSGWALVGIHAMQKIGAYSLTVIARPGAGGEVRASIPVRVRGGPFATEDIPLSPERQQLLDPELVRAEEARVKRVWGQLSPQPLWQGPFRLPLQEERITSFFGTRRSYNGGPVSGFHTGTDLGAEEGTPIFAPAAGRVALAEQLAVRGRTTLIDHGLGVFSGYFHQSQINVEPGEMVQAGDLIGYVGNTGLSSGAHLHWELRVAGIAVDPMQWVGVLIP
jgi:murein DD-endopeptidase MepM/ murein hydrolase activator NlpD